MFESELMTPKECCNYRRCSGRKLDRERAERRGPPYVRIDGRIFYRRSDVDRFIGTHLCGDESLGADVGTEPVRRRRGRPRIRRTGSKVLVTSEAAADWRREDTKAGPR
jgi:hypothetical protein